MLKRKTRNLSGLLALLLTLLLALPAAAAGSAGLTIYHERENVRFDLYHVAVESDAGWQPTDDFAAYPVTLPDESSPASAWRAAAETLAAYAARDSLTPLASGHVSGGRVEFPALEEGLYLAVGETTREGDTRYQPVPVLIHVQGDTEATVKAEEVAVEPEQVEYTVAKVWQGGENKRPLSVTVQLLCDGQQYQTVSLNALNGWRYTWTSEPGRLWQVAEEACPDGFTVTVEQDGLTFTVTNTWQEPQQPGNPDQPGSTPAPGTPPAGQPGGTLPQTGQLWWPVPLLLILGVLCVGIGQLRAHRKHKHDHEG